MTSMPIMWYATFDFEYERGREGVEPENG